MVPINELTKEDVLKTDTLEEIFDQEDELKRAEMLAELSVRAKELKCKAEFSALLATFEKVLGETKKDAWQHDIVEGWTNFTDCPYEQMECGRWIATDKEIYQENPFGHNDVLACYHPILPLERMKNLETGEEQLKLAYKRNGQWEEIIAPKTMVASATRIVALSGRGVAVTSESAKYLVKYLAEVEARNDNQIKVQYSSSKLGWIGNGFLPYDTDVIFDGNSRFRQIFDSIGEFGDEAAWMDHVRELRKSGRREIKIILAASFASVLVHQVGALPFILDLWGETESGKTVALMLACSVWADPDENRYIGDFKSTDVALEARADMLNHLPVLLDDTSKTSARIRENFEGVVYDLCSGKGKSRSNKELGINRENHWSNCFLTNGERPLNGYVNQGGAINRILELECMEDLFKDPQKTTEVLKKNYGFAGRRFVDVIKRMEPDEIKKTQQFFQGELLEDEKMQKQAMAMSIILTADFIAEEHIFKDNVTIAIDEAKKVLIDRNELSDNERAYQFITDKVMMNAQRFDDETKCEKWGIVDDGYAVIFNSAFTELCNSGNFSRKSFLPWAERNGLLQTQKGQLTKVKRIHGNICRCVWIKLDEEKTEGSDWITLDANNGAGLESAFD